MWDDDDDLHECARSCAKHSNAKTIENVYLNGCHAYFARFLFCFPRSLAAATDADGAVAENSFHFVFSGKMKRKCEKGIFNRKNIGKIYCSSSRQRFIDGVEERLFSRGSPCLVNYSKKKNEHVLVHATAMVLA